MRRLPLPVYHLRRFIPALLVLLAIAAPARVLAAPNANDAAAAEALFADGKRLMSEGRYAQACPKFAESQRLDPGIGTMLWLGECYGKNGQTASAWAIFHEAEALAAKQKDPRASVAREEASKLEPKLSKLVIDVALVQGTSGLEIKRDGVILGKPLWGTPIPIDPGDHTIVASAPQKKPWQGKVSVPPSGSIPIYVKIPELEAAPVAPPPPPSTPAEPVDTSKGRTQRILGLVAAGVGLVGVGVGTYFGLQVKSKNDDSNADNHCNGNVCDQVGYDARKDALTAATISDISFIAGGVFLVGGAVLFFTAPSGSSASSGAAKATPRVGIGPSLGGAVLHGSF